MVHSFKIRIVCSQRKRKSQSSNKVQIENFSTKIHASVISQKAILNVPVWGALLAVESPERHSNSIILVPIRWREVRVEGHWSLKEVSG